MLFNALVISALATTTLAYPHIKRTNEIRTTSVCLGVDCTHTSSATEISAATGTVSGSVAHETTCVGTDCETFDCVGPDCDTMGCQGPDCMLTMECTGPDCISVPCEGGDCSLPTNTTTESTQCVGDSCTTTNCVGTHCSSTTCTGSACPSSLSANIDSIATSTIEYIATSTLESTTTSSIDSTVTSTAACTGPMCESSPCTGTGCIEPSNCTGPNCPSSTTSSICPGPNCIEPSSTSSTCPGPNCIEPSSVSSTCPGPNCMDGSSLSSVCPGPNCMEPTAPGLSTCTGTGCATVTCDSTDPALCPTSTCDGTSDASNCDSTSTTSASSSTATTSDIPSNHMPGGPHMPTFSHLPLPSDASDMPTCGSADWIMGSPCDCPTGSYSQSSTTVGNWPVPASDMMNVTGNFWSTAWAGEDAADIQGKTGSTVGDMRLFSVMLPGANKPALITEKLVKMQRNEDGGYSMMFGFIDMPLTYYEADGSLGQIGSSWDSMDVASTGPKSCQMTWTTAICASGHTDLAGAHESAMKNITAIMQDMGALSSMLTPTDINSM